MKYIKLFPLGEVIEERVDLSKKYKLLEFKDCIWRVTQKCRKNYDPLSYLQYLKGDLEKPVKNTTPILRKQMAIQDLLKM